MRYSETKFLHDKSQIEAFLRRNIPLNIYALGDLDDLFWEKTIWPALKKGTGIQYTALLYNGASCPTLLALCDTRTRRWASDLLKSIIGLLPPVFYAHLSPGLAEILGKTYKLKSHGLHYKMTLTDKRRILSEDSSKVKVLSKRDLPALVRFYQRAYPGNWFDPHTLETWMYFGLMERDAIAAAAGVHVYSKKYKVAAIGNIATAPDMRGRGFASKVTAKLCRALLKHTEHIGLNVYSKNKAAIACYRRLGFELTAPYEEYSASMLR